MTGFSPARAYHALTGVLYALGPVTLFLLARKLCGSRGCAFAAGLLYSVLAPSSFLMPAVRNDAGGLWNARRLQALVQYGEGPHVGSMTLIPLALLLFSVALEKRRPGWWFLAALGLAAVPLTNWLGAPVLAVAAACWLLVEAHGWRKHLPAALLLGLWAYAIACRWIPPSTIHTVRSNEKYISGELSAGRWFWAIGGLAAAFVMLWILRRLRASNAMCFTVLFALPVSLIPLASEWAGVRLMPQPHRYHLEMEMALVLVAVFAVQAVAARLPAPTRVVLVVALAALCLYPALRHRRHARQLIRPIDIGTTIEYRAASWIDKHMEGRRVLLPGSIGFFLNAFTDTPQFAGGFDQAAINPLWTHVHHQLMSSEGAGLEEGSLAIRWLKVFGVDAVGVSGAGSREAFKPFRNPKKFEGLLPVLRRDGDDVIYSLNRRSPSLAHVIRREDLPPRPPRHGLDVAPLRPYLRALDDPALPVTPQHVLVLRNAGPVGAGMPEAGSLPIPQSLAQAGVRDMVRVSDARMSGTAYGTVVLHCSPEAAHGGPLALVRDGDPIELDVAERRIDLRVDAAELARRRAQFRPPPPPARGWRRLYCEHLLPAHLGADLDFLAS